MSDNLLTGTSSKFHQSVKVMQWHLGLSDTTYKWSTSQSYRNETNDKCLVSYTKFKHRVLFFQARNIAHTLNWHQINKCVTAVTN